MNKLISESWTEEDMVEVLVADNVIRNPNTSEEQKETAQELILGVEARVQSLLEQRKRRKRKKS